MSHLLTAALANDCSQINYIADRAECELGGYELATTPAGAVAGEVVVAAAVDLGRACCRGLLHRSTRDGGTQWDTAF